MPASPTTFTVPPTGPGAPKLRSSCDSCGTAKVKCDRNQPECGRCATLGLACVYGLSRHFGKPPRKRPAIVLDEGAARCKKRTTHIDESRNHHIASDYTQPQSFNQSGQLEFSNSTPDMHSSTSGLVNPLRMDEQDQFSSAIFPSLFLDEWPQMDGFGFGLEIPSVPKSSATEGRLSASALEPVNSMRMDTASHKSHSCPRESYEVFRDLICPAPDLHVPEAHSDPVSAQLDQVLCFTRNAIDRLTQILRCPCASSGHRVMVHASTISRILMWYQQAAGWTCRPSQPLGLVNSPTSSSVSPYSPPSYDTAADTDTVSTPTLAQCTGFVVEHVPVSMGTFSIEDQNMQAAIRTQLVLSELKKMANLIDLFTSQDSCESSASGIAGLHAHLGAWLRSEHSRTVRILTTRLSALNDI
ncbi:uncharacterized protein BDZ99DRAFT_518993 [Mytilinidion resinicola]|uniref:Zn(2)-C6 fungal-type domain-containing protein n=1 Tax=Mytilinidion resinicola TaxID=574789 RepID=A0A6A6YS37_9PEZI|nr:uncharacterized protein BDZ99DRAFT_518993 [Mytilinidion resinicola]KAF2811742.1 hypothetical protein BDZ99DRAFT_518993 [Mytilinidion resinicola]